MVYALLSGGQMRLLIAVSAAVALAAGAVLAGPVPGAEANAMEQAAHDSVSADAETGAGEREIAAGDSAPGPEPVQDGWLKRAGKTAAGVLGRILLYAVLLVALVLIPLGMGGTFIMVGAAALFGLATGFEHITLKLLAVLLGLALVGEGVESLLGVAMARRYGASKWGMWGAFIGGVGGAIIGAPVPVAGNLVGALVGVFVGAFLLEWLGRGRSDESLKAGWGALLGRTAASAIKLGLGMVILILIVSRTLI
jgi:uncharacterized protein YqgC (DUF456 family)